MGRDEIFYQSFQRSSNMLNLSAEEINLTSPYKVCLGDANSFYFTTSAGSTYNIGFVQDYMISDEGVYQFYIIDVNHSHSQRDPFVKATVQCVIEAFFRQEPYVMLYICDPSDQRQGMRSRLFHHWFEEYEHHEQFTMINEEIMFDGIMYYGSIILRKDHPYYQELTSKFHAVIAGLPEKIENL